jgi:sortase A
VRPARGRWRRVVIAIALAFGLAGVAQAGWIHAKAWLAQLLIAAAWDRAREDAGPARPWPWADTRPVARLYLPGDAAPLYVLEGASGSNLAFGPAHDPVSALPGGPGNSVIAGHRDTHFRALEQLRVEDRLRVELPDGQALWFEVTALEVVDARRWRIALDTGAPRLTLVTCFPFQAIDPGGPLRFVATAVPVVLP